MFSKKTLSIFLIIALVLTIAVACTKPDEKEPGESEENSVDYPIKPITLQLGYSAGGSSDVMCRLLAASLEKHIGQPVVVLNKPGAGGWVSWEEIIKNTKPDGYTFTLINDAVTIGAYDEANPREYTADDFDLLANHVIDYNVLVIRNDEKRFTDFASLVEYAKDNELLTSASDVGILSDDATLVNMMNKELGTKIQVVPSDGAKEDETMFISKNTDIFACNVADAFAGHNSNQYKIVAVAAPERVSIIPEVPTTKELGFDNLIMSSARGYGLPKGVDPKVKEILLEGIKKAINDPELVNKLNELGFETVYIEGQEYVDELNDFAKRLRDVYGL